MPRCGERRDKNRCYPHPAARFLCNIHINTNIFTRLINVIIWFIIITSDYKTGRTYS